MPDILVEGTLQQPLRQSKEAATLDDLKYQARHWPIIGDLKHQILYGLGQFCVLIWFCTQVFYQPLWFVEAIQGLGVPRIWCPLIAGTLAFDAALCIAEQIMAYRFASNCLWDYVDTVQNDVRRQELEHVHMHAIVMKAIAPPLGACIVGFISLKVTNNPQSNAMMLGTVMPWAFCNLVHSIAKNVVRMTSKIDVALIEDMAVILRSAFPIEGCTPCPHSDANTQEFWIRMLEHVGRFQNNLHGVWSSGAVVLFAALAVDGIHGFFCALFAVTTTNLDIQVGFFCCLMSICALAMRTLYPLANATARCQSMTPCSKQNQSIRQLAAQGATQKLSVEAMLQHMSFMAHMDRSDFGINIPILGTVTTGLLVSKAGILAAVVPSAFAIARNRLQAMSTSEPDAFNATLT